MIMHYTTALNASKKENDAFFFVVWQGIYDSGQTQEKDGDRAFIPLPLQPALLLRSDAGK